MDELKNVENAKKKLNSNVNHERKTIDKDMKKKLNPLLFRGFGCLLVLMTMALIFGSISWISETFNIDEVPIVIVFLTVIYLFTILFS